LTGGNLLEGWNAAVKEKHANSGAAGPGFCLTVATAAPILSGKLPEERPPGYLGAWLEPKGNSIVNNKLSAAFAAVLCLMAANHAKATVTQTGSLLWSGDLTGLQTGPSITPVVINDQQAYGGVFSFPNSGATFSGDASTSGGGVIRPGWPGAEKMVPATGLAATTNYLWDYHGGSITMTTPAPESYLGFLTAASGVPTSWTDPFNITLFSGTTSLGEITSAQLESAAVANGYAWININVANGGTYTSAVFSETYPTLESTKVFDISYGTTSVAAPLPALAGTLPGFAAAILGMIGLRRRGSRHA